MTIMKKEFLISLILISVLSQNLMPQEKIPLKGKWQFAIDPLDEGNKNKWFAKAFEESINLPGSMAEYGKGFDISLETKWTGNIIDSSFFKSPEYEKYRKPESFKIPFWLQPQKSYVGVAWYKREIKIPDNWQDNSIELYFERCHWQSSVWVDDLFVGTQNALGAPHIYNLTGKLSPGKHTITVCIDNRIKEVNPGVNSSSLTDHSQTNWNGIIGEMFLQSRDKIHFGDIRIFTDVHTRKATVEM